jgi:phytol kinase
MNNRLARYLTNLPVKGQTHMLKKEFIRKIIHISGGFIVILANINTIATFYALAAVTALFIGAEALRLKNIPVPLIAYVTHMAGRGNIKNTPVLGPVTLALGIMLSMALFPLPAASIAILALTFGDGVASLVGKTFGLIKPAVMHGKSIEGSLACFIAVLCSTYFLGYFYQFPAPFLLACTVAAAATATEALPLKSFDNIAIPLVSGLTVLIMLMLVP